MFPSVYESGGGGVGGGGVYVNIYICVNMFVTSLVRTAGHKMAALTVVFSRLSNVGF